MSSTPNKERGLEQDSLTSITTDDNKPQVYTDYSKDANKSSSTGVTTLDNLFDDNSDTETKVDNTTTLMFKFTDKKAVRMLTLTSSKSGRTPDMALMKMITGFYWETTMTVAACSLIFGASIQDHLE